MRLSLVTSNNRIKKAWYLFVIFETIFLITPSITKQTCFIFPFGVKSLLNRFNATWPRSSLFGNIFSRRSCRGKGKDSIKRGTGHMLRWGSLDAICKTYRNPGLHWFCFIVPCDWFRKLAPSSQPIRSKVQQNAPQSSTCSTFPCILVGVRSR